MIEVFGGQSAGGMESAVSFVSSLTVSSARLAGALSRLNV